MICNACGKKILYKGEIPQEDVCTFIKEWGYFSKKDLQVHKFNLCEECYDRITSSFAVPVEISEKTEVMSMPFLLLFTEPPHPIRIRRLDRLQFRAAH